MKIVKKKEQLLLFFLFQSKIGDTKRSKKSNYCSFFFGGKYLHTMTVQKKRAIVALFFDRLHRVKSKV